MDYSYLNQNVEKIKEKIEAAALRSKRDVKDITLLSAIKSADVVVICVPLSSKTKRMFNKNMFSLMKDGSVFVNVSRGEIVEEKSLISALDDKLLGAVVDVFETEPLDTQSQLWEKENVILTPHNSFVGDGNSRRLYKVIESNLRDYKCQ
jgi:phosphoglycerate dehydrogenase-like enzyme